VPRSWEEVERGEIDGLEGTRRRLLREGNDVLRRSFLFLLIS